MVDLGRAGIPLNHDPSIRMRFDGVVSASVCHQSFFDRHTIAVCVLYGGKKCLLGYAMAPAQTPTSTMALPNKKRGEMTSSANHAVIAIVATGYNK